MANFHFTSNIQFHNQYLELSYDGEFQLVRLNNGGYSVLFNQGEGEFRYLRSRNQLMTRDRAFDHSVEEPIDLSAEPPRLDDLTDQIVELRKQVANLTDRLEEAQIAAYEDHEEREELRQLLQIAEHERDEMAGQLLEEADIPEVSTADTEPVTPHFFD